MRIEYDKVVRDRIPDIILEAGKSCELRALPTDQFLPQLVDKLEEEIAEYRESGAIEELADVVEVVQAIVENSGMAWDDFEAMRARKREERGAFRRRLLLVSVTEDGVAPAAGKQDAGMASTSGQLTPLVKGDEIRDAYEAFSRRLQEGCVAYDRNVGFQGGNLPCRLHWNPGLGFWVGFRESIKGSRYVSWYGLADPRQVPMPGITCEINFPIEGVNRRVAGAFARDDSGRLFVVHSGKVGGGRAGISKSAFTRHHRGGERVVLRWPDGQETPYYLLYALDAPDLAARIAGFVRTVDEFKGLAVTGGTPG